MHWNSAVLGLAIFPALAGAEPAPEYWRAINLARRLRVTDTAVLNEYRIRICSQRGRSAADYSTTTTVAVLDRVVKGSYVMAGIRLEKPAGMPAEVVTPLGRFLLVDLTEQFTPLGRLGAARRSAPGIPAHLRSSLNFPKQAKQAKQAN